MIPRGIPEALALRFVGHFSLREAETLRPRSRRPVDPTGKMTCRSQYVTV